MVQFRVPQVEIGKDKIVQASRNHIGPRAHEPDERFLRVGGQVERDEGAMFPPAKTPSATHEAREVDRGGRAAAFRGGAAVLLRTYGMVGYSRTRR